MSRLRYARHIRVSNSLIRNLWSAWQERAIRRGLQPNDLYRAYFAGYKRAIAQANSILATVHKEHLGELDAAQRDRNTVAAIRDALSGRLFTVQSELRAARDELRRCK